jgi:putative endopeptidase
MLKTVKLSKFLIAILSFQIPLAFSNTDSKAHLHLDWRNTKISPSEDFYDYATGNWQKQNPIPAEHSSWGTFDILNEKTQLMIKNMLIAASKKPNKKPGSTEQKVGDFYFSGMNEAVINNEGIKPLQPELAKIEAIKNLKELQEVIAHLQLIGVNAFFNFGSMQDFKNSKEMIAVAMQGGLGLPDRDYYLKEDQKFKDIRAAYVKHISATFQLLGDTPESAAKKADKIMAIETTFAKNSLSQIEQRDPYAVYHMKNLKKLEKIMPNLSWPEYFASLNLPKLTRINLAMPKYFKMLDKQLAQVPLPDWKAYLRWHLISAFSPYLSQPFVDQNFRMNSILTGAKKLQPRWKRVVKTESQNLGFAVGKMYVKKYFSAADKEAVMTILNNIRNVLKKDLKNLDWMTPETRTAAIKKLDLIEGRVGYPSKWRDYSSLKIDRGPYVLNVIRANIFNNQYELNKIDKPVDRTEWAMTPQMVNAYYDSSMNNINIPAGILHSPFYDPKVPSAMNYGAIGFVIGHEITHGFDDEGAQFDGNGNLKNWWKPADLKKFKAATNCIAEQFSKYKVNGDLFVQGKLVVGEAAADLGGAILAYRAFTNSKDYKEAKTINGITPDQQFFLGVAHVWASNIRPEYLRNLVITDPHPPAKYRVNGTLANMPEFKKAFAIKKVTVMANEKPCAIW